MSQTQELDIIKKGCHALGAFKTARLVSGSTDKIKILIRYLISSEALEPAYLVAMKHLEEADREEFLSALETVSTELRQRSYERNCIRELLGEDAKKREPRKQKEEAQAAPKKKMEIPTTNKEGVEYMTLAHTKYEEDSITLVKTAEEFEGVADNLKSETLLAFDLMSTGTEISTVSLASATQVIVFDAVSLGDAKTDTLFKLLEDLFTSDSVTIVTFSFARDAFVLGEATKIDPSSITNVVDLTEMWKGEEEGRRVELSKMLEMSQGKALSQYHRKLDWSKGPRNDGMINFVTLNAQVKLSIYDHALNEKKLEATAFAYEEPKGLREKLEAVETRRKEAATKKAKAPRRKKSRREKREARKGGDSPAKRKGSSDGRRNSPRKGGKRSRRGGKQTEYVKVSRKDE